MRLAGVDSADTPLQRMHRVADAGQGRAAAGVRAAGLKDDVELVLRRSLVDRVQRPVTEEVVRVADHDLVEAVVVGGDSPHFVGSELRRAGAEDVSEPRRRSSWPSHRVASHSFVALAIEALKRGFDRAVSRGAMPGLTMALATPWASISAIASAGVEHGAGALISASQMLPGSRPPQSAPTIAVVSTLRVPASIV